MPVMVYKEGAAVLYPFSLLQSAPAVDANGLEWFTG